MILPHAIPDRADQRGPIVAKETLQQSVDGSDLFSRPQARRHLLQRVVSGREGADNHLPFSIGQDKALLVRALRRLGRFRYIP
jgi:hypothetical protein